METFLKKLGNLWLWIQLNFAYDDKVGSIKVGKDADIVLWNNNPLSIYAKAEKTIIEGVVYYDVEKR
jgi:imidazolonepropionase-like amidohydrolase